MGFGTVHGLVDTVPMTPATPAFLLCLADAPVLRSAAAGDIALGAREGVLLAWLALEGPTPRARMARLLWPDSEPEAARNALRQRLFHLKRLAGEALVTGSTTLSLAP